MDTFLDRETLETIFHFPNNDGSYGEEQRSFLATQGARRPIVFLAFPPKAAGTFLRGAAATAARGQVLRVCYAQGDRDAQPYLPTFLAYYAGGLCRGPLITHVHMQAFPANTLFLEAFGIRPVVMVRSIPDMLASYWDMLDDGDGGSSLPMGLNCTIPPGFRAMPAEERAKIMIDIIAPWYVGYYATWSRYAQANPGAVRLLHYSDFVRDPAGTLMQILDASGLAATRDQCQQAIDEVWAERFLHRYSEGVEGRGGDYFSTAQTGHIDRMLSYYPSTMPLRSKLLGL